MLINIPLQIDEKVIESQLSIDYEAKIMDYIFKQVETILLEKSKKNRGYYAKSDATPDEGLQIIMSRYIEKYLEARMEVIKKEIIEQTSEKLALRMTKMKKVKEMTKEAEDE